MYAVLCRWGAKLSFPHKYCYGRVQIGHRLSGETDRKPEFVLSNLCATWKARTLRKDLKVTSHLICQRGTKKTEIKLIRTSINVQKLDSQLLFPLLFKYHGSRKQGFFVFLVQLYGNGNSDQETERYKNINSVRTLNKDMQKAGLCHEVRAMR